MSRIGLHPMQPPDRIPRWYSSLEMVQQSKVLIPMGQRSSLLVDSQLTRTVRRPKVVNTIDPESEAAPSMFNPLLVTQPRIEP